MNEIILTTILYVIIICFLGYLLFNYFKKECVQEGMRTLPRPVINAEYNQPVQYKPSPPYFGETLDQMIDRYIGSLFDVRGMPYFDTIDYYQSTCAFNGNVDSQCTGTLPADLYINQRSKLTDIGYYILNIVIPNIQSTNNPFPEEKWPPIVWTNKAPFPIKKSVAPTYQVYQGAAYAPSTSSSSSSSSSSDDTNGSSSTTTTDGSTDGSSSSTSGTSPDTDGSSDGSCGDLNALSKCGIACPTSCLDNVAAAQAEIDRLNELLEEEEDQESVTAQSLSMNMGWLNFIAYQQTGQAATQTALPNGTATINNIDNTLTIGNTEFKGYPTTELSANPDNAESGYTGGTVNTLSETIAQFINDYFISDPDDDNYNRPTKEALLKFDSYTKNKAPMDENHKNKLRDVVYYFMQIIVPGLPEGTVSDDCTTNTFGTAFVEWIPIKWLSLTERKHFVQK